MPGVTHGSLGSHVLFTNKRKNGALYVQTDESWDPRIVLFLGKGYLISTLVPFNDKGDLECSKSFMVDNHASILHKLMVFLTCLLFQNSLGLQGNDLFLLEKGLYFSSKFLEKGYIYIFFSSHSSK